MEDNPNGTVDVCRLMQCIGKVDLAAIGSLEEATDSDRDESDELRRIAPPISSSLLAAHLRSRKLGLQH